MKKQKALKQFTDINDCLVRAKQGEAEAQCYLGSVYDFGRQGVSQDRKKAFEWYTLSAEQGLAIAQYALGMMYIHYKGVARDKGDKEGVTQNNKKAFKWFRLAAEQGNAEAEEIIYNKYTYNKYGIDLELERSQYENGMNKDRSYD